MRIRCLYLPVWLCLPLSAALGQDSRLGQISGRVEDRTSAPLVGASVTLLSLNRVRQTRSSSDGAFQFENVDLGTYLLEITAPGFEKKTIPVTLSSSHPQETISAVVNVGSVPDMATCGRNISVSYEDARAKGSSLTGILREYFAHKPIARAEVTIVSEAALQIPVVVRSDRMGRFSVSHLAPDYYNIRIFHKDYEPEELKHVAIPLENKVSLESTLLKRKQLMVCQ